MSQQRRTERGGFTLIEMLLVLALLVTVASLAIPSARGSLRNQRLRQGAERLRAELIEARVKAMRTGMTHVFVYSTVTGQFMSVTHVTNTDELSESQLRLIDGQADYAATIESGGTLPDDVAESLPEDVSFGDVSAWDDHSLQGAVGSSVAGGISSPILFFPDGTSSNAHFTVVGTNGYSILVTVRGLTGTVRVSKRSGQQ